MLCPGIGFFITGGSVIPARSLWKPMSLHQSLIACQSFVCCPSNDQNLNRKTMRFKSHSKLYIWKNTYICININICKIQIISKFYSYTPNSHEYVQNTWNKKQHKKLKHESISIYLNQFFFVFFGPRPPALAVSFYISPGVQESKVINWNKVSMESSTSPKRIWSRCGSAGWVGDGGRMGQTPCATGGWG